MRIRESTHEVGFRVVGLVAELAELHAVALQLLGDLELEVWQRLADVVHEDLAHAATRALRTRRPVRRRVFAGRAQERAGRTRLSLRARKGVPQYCALLA